MIALLHLMQRMPNSGLLVIEELEAGLHPQAQVRLVEALVDISLRKHIQVICSTHSEIVLDRLPREARLLIRRSGNEHSTTEFPSTRFALYEMSGTTQPELAVYCEDNVARVMIQEALADV